MGSQVYDTKVLNGKQRRALAREVRVQGRKAKNNAAQSPPGGKAPHPIGARRLVCAKPLPCDFCGQAAGNTDGAGPVCFFCWNAIYQTPTEN